jgi:hypothetical protein
LSDALIVWNFVTVGRVTHRYSMLKSFLGSPRPFDWHKSRAHVLLLSKYAHRPAADDAFANDPKWLEVLGEQLPNAIQRLLADGVLIPCDLAEHLDRKLTVPQLKDILKTRGLKATGRKPDLIASLVAADPEAARQAVAGLTVVKASAGGQAIAEQYSNAETARRLQAEQQTAAALRERRYSQAARVTCAFEAAQVFPRDQLLGAASVAQLRQWWAKKDVADDEALLRELWAGTPASAARLSPNHHEVLRLAAAMRWLWGPKPGNWLPDDFATELALDSSWLPLLFENYAWHRQEVKQLRAQGIKRVQIGNCNDDGVCQACWSLAGRKYRLEEVPELPYARCTSETGCRCTIRAVIE